MAVQFASFASAARGATLTAALLLVASNLWAHDLWIEPSTFHPAPGATISVGLRVGQNFVGDPVPRSSRLIEQFIVRQTGGDKPIAGSENIDPAGWFRADAEATAVVAYSSLGSYVELPAPKFEEYLRQEGLERIVDIRTARGERERPGRERFFRYAKTLLAGGRTSVRPMQPIGLAYEIVPDEDPTVRFVPFRGRVLHAGKPLAGALVVAMLRSNPSVRLSMRSDDRGGFAFVLPHAGIWLIKSVHMVRASMFSSADWDSLWASLTFQAPEPPSAAAAQSAR